MLGAVKGVAAEFHEQEVELYVDVAHRLALRLRVGLKRVVARFGHLEQTVTDKAVLLLSGGGIYLAVRIEHVLRGASGVKARLLLRVAHDGGCRSFGAALLYGVLVDDLGVGGIAERQLVAARGIGVHRAGRFDLEGLAYQALAGVMHVHAQAIRVGAGGKLSTGQRVVDLAVVDGEALLVGLNRYRLHGFPRGIKDDGLDFLDGVVGFHGAAEIVGAAQRDLGGVGKLRAGDLGYRALLFGAPGAVDDLLAGFLVGARLHVVLLARFELGDLHRFA